MPKWSSGSGPRKSNNNPVFLVTGDGNVRADGTFASPAADYAEYFEWEDGNLDREDRVGMTVSLVGDKIRVAQPGDTVIGVVSAKPAMVGDAAETHWQGRYVKDEYGRIMTEPYQVYSWTDEKGHPQSMASYEVNKPVNLPKMLSSAIEIRLVICLNAMSRPRGMMPLHNMYHVVSVPNGLQSDLSVNYVCVWDR